MVRVSEGKLLRIFCLVALVALLVLISDIITSNRVFSESFTALQIFKWSWYPNLGLIFIYSLTIALSFLRIRWSAFLVVLFIYPYAYNAFLLLGHVTFSGIGFWISYAEIIVRLLYAITALILIFRYLARFLGLLCRDSL